MWGVGGSWHRCILLAVGHVGSTRRPPKIIISLVFLWRGGVNCRHHYRRSHGQASPPPSSSISFIQHHRHDPTSPADIADTILIAEHRQHHQASSSNIFTTIATHHRRQSLSILRFYFLIFCFPLCLFHQHQTPSTSNIIIEYHMTKHLHQHHHHQASALYNTTEPDQA